MSSMHPMAQMPGFDAMRAQQHAFFKAMTGGMMGSSGPMPETEGDTHPNRQPRPARPNPATIWTR